ncbi:hypothetical protein CDAR_217721 [Caerostris darwini]|uniref:Uncharacterized protein n=1 Tax=Caerostris darwini TaxID=1538125 RepID=A0AAV4U9C9_9ARAC|nr:hypothetical protein CDAR_217721 [Caerostris darwini]
MRTQFALRTDDKRVKVFREEASTFRHMAFHECTVCLGTQLVFFEYQFMFLYTYNPKGHVSMASRKRMEDSERWPAVRCIEAGQLITVVGIFFAVHHSVVSRSWKQFLISQTSGRSKIIIDGRSIYCCYSQMESKNDLHMCSIYSCTVY